MAPKDILQKKVEKKLSLLLRVIKSEIKESFLRIWNPIKYLFSWIWGKVLGYSRHVFKIFGGILPWAGLIIFIVLWYFTVTRAPEWVWNQTPNFDSQSALSTANKLDGDIAKDEINLVEQITQAISFERKGNLESALGMYQSSEKSSLPITQTYATQAIKRVQSHMSNPLWQVLYDFNNFLIQTPRWAGMFIGAFGALLILLFIYYQIPVKQGFAIGEFVTPKSLDKESEYGLEIRQTLADTIALIHLTHRSAQENLSLLTERLVLPNFGLSGSDKNELLNALIEIGDAPVLNTTGLSITKLLNAINLFSQRRRYLLTGSLNKLDGQWYLTVKMLESRNKGLLNQWEIRQSELNELGLLLNSPQGNDQNPQNQDLEVIRNLSQALSYKILFTILKKSAPSLEAKSWKSFYYLTEGLWGIQEYGIDSTAIVPRDRAVDHLEKLVNQLDYGNRIARFDLGLLYLMQGDVQEAQLVFEYLKNSIDSRPEAILDKIYKSLIEGGSSKKAKSLISRYLWRKYAKELEEIAQENRGGILPVVAQTWKRLTKELAEYIKGSGLDFVNESSVKSSLKVLFENPDTQKPFRRIVGFAEDSATQDAIKEFIKILDDEDHAAVLKIADSLNGRSETTRADWEYISKILDLKHINEMDQELSRFGSDLDLIQMTSEFLNNEEKITELAKGFMEFGEKVRSKAASNFADAVVTVLLDDDLEKAIKFYSALRLYLAEANPYMAKIKMQQLLLKAEMPYQLWLYALLQPEETEDYISLSEWQTSKRQPLYVETLYNLAFSHYLSYSPKGYVAAVEYTKELLEHIKSSSKLAVNLARQDEIKNLAICLQVKAYVNAYLSLWDGVRPSDSEEGFKIEDLHKTLDGIEKGYSRHSVSIESILKLTHHKSIDVQTIAYETVGLWYAYKNSFIGQDHEVYFQSALSMRSWASSYIYLATSKSENKNYDEAFRLLTIARRQMPKLDYIELLEKRWLAKMEEEKAKVEQSVPAVDGISE